MRSTVRVSNFPGGTRSSEFRTSRLREEQKSANRKGEPGLSGKDA